MPAEILIRNATYSDIDFITECIVQAEKGTGDTISYCKIFNISETEFREVTKKILSEGICNFEFSIQSFKLVESDGKPAGAYGAWMEGIDGISSGILKLSAFRSFLSKESINHYKTVAGIANEIGFNRKPGTVQFESIFVPEAYRGRSIGGLLVEALCKDLLQQYPLAEEAYVQVMKHNAVSLHAHEKYGFRIIEEKTGTNPDLLKIYSGNKRVLMKKLLR